MNTSIDILGVKYEFGPLVFYLFGPLVIFFGPSVFYLFGPPDSIYRTSSTRIGPKTLPYLGLLTIKALLFCLSPCKRSK